MPRGRRPHHQSKFYTACPRTRAGWSSTVFARESPTRSAGFDAENRLYLFALTVPVDLLPTWAVRIKMAGDTGCIVSDSDNLIGGIEDSLGKTN
jgi:hypothetical protein